MDGNECGVAGCTGPRLKRGYCNRHYKRWRTYGDPLGGGPERVNYASAEERFWVKVDKTAGPDACWPWMGARRPDGYGIFSWRAVRLAPVIASRTAFYFANGRWPQEAMHLCDNPPCVNPAHLKDGTHESNMADGYEKGRMTRRAALTSEAIAEVRQALKNGEPITQIAARFEVSRGTIYRIKSPR